MLLITLMNFAIDLVIYISNINDYQYIWMLYFETLLCIDGSRASDFGLMKIDNKGRILSFSEKPKGEDLKAMVNLVSIILVIQVSYI